MMHLVRRLSQFLANMDAKTATSLLVSLLLLVFVLFMMFFGREFLSIDEEGQLGSMLGRVAESRWAIVGVVSIFAVLALTGFPQILLITATVFVFGPLNGAIYSWVATMTSATMTFGLGHYLGGRWVRRYGGERVQSLIDFLGRHGILASGVIRVVPSGPFIVVNAAAGAAHIPLWKYWAGSGVGIVPKIALVAALSAFAPDEKSLDRGVVSGIWEDLKSREPSEFLMVIAIVIAWFAFLAGIRLVYVRLRKAPEPTISINETEPALPAGENDGPESRESL